MKITTVFLADGANLGPTGKVNILGAGVRIIGPTRFPSVTPVVVVAIAEAAAPDDLGDHPVKLTLRKPGEKETTLLEGRVTVADRPADEKELPVEVHVQVGMPLITDRPGLHVLGVQIGNARAKYRFLVRGEAGSATASA